MRQRPPENLLTLLKELRLATPGQTAAVERRARRLARGLPLFLSVWVDALANARLLTPFQAAEINGGRGERLRLGPYVLQNRLGDLGFAETFEARHIESGAVRRLAVYRCSEDRAGLILEGLEQVVVASRDLPRGVLAPIEDRGGDGDRLWAACDPYHGRTAAEAMIFHGRFPPAVVLQIARAMMPGLVALEQAGLCHGDLRAATLTLGSIENDVTRGPRLPFPGLRAVVRPREGYAYLDLPPEALDGLAPERIRDGTPPNAASDVYALGCLWWHLLTGRDPLPGGDGLTKLQTAHRAEVGDPRLLAPDTPSELLAAIRACTRPLSNERPAGMAELAAMLGPIDPREPARLDRALRGIAGPIPRRRPAATRSSSLRRKQAWLGAAAALAVSIALLSLTFWFEGRPRAARQDASVASTSADQTAIKTAIKTSIETSARKPVGTPAETPAETPTPIAPLPLDIRAVTESGNRTRPDDGGVIHASAVTTVDMRTVPKCSTTAPGCDETPTESHRGGPETALPDWNSTREPVAHLSLRPGQRVWNPSGERVLLRVAPQGLLVDTPDVVFENVDFVLDEADGATAGQEATAMLVLQSPGITLRGCTFRATSHGVDAIRWIHPADETTAAMSLPSGAIVAERCVFARVEAAVDCRARGALALRFSNVLHVGVGPLARLRHLHGPDEPIVLSLDRTTLRGSGPVVQFDAFDERSVGGVRIETNDCVFALRAGEP
ncbi:MAG: protein kinase, partial [Pirellulaceae bacterium]|nr:protein kinase [Pirellulaceae bacterium]